MGVDTTCNTTLADLRITAESPLAGGMTFHEIGFIICAACTLIACLLSGYLIMMHATHYTKPYEQRHIIRILFMVPVYAIAALLTFMFYWHSIYFQVISDCYEAFAIASFFALLCSYIAPNLHDQKNYFRGTQPKPWVWPLNWLRQCCGGEHGPWRTPRSGLTWFNIIWTGIYQYCFIRVAMTITAVLTEYYGRYCESSVSPVFAHIWVLGVECIAVSIAMYCVIQFYIQLRHDLADHRPFLKVLAIKLVIFLSFWQTSCISLLISTNAIGATASMAYPDVAVGIPSLLICVEMALFSVLHIFAYPYSPYTSQRAASKYPRASLEVADHGLNETGANQGGFLGCRAILDAMNPLDLVRAFARGVRWLFVGFRHREEDVSYKINSNDVSLETTHTAYKTDTASSLPIADEFRRSRFGMPVESDEGAGLIEHAQPNPLQGQNRPGSSSPRYQPARERFDPVTGQELNVGGRAYGSEGEVATSEIGVATSSPYVSQQYSGRPQQYAGGPQQYSGRGQQYSNASPQQLDYAQQQQQQYSSNIPQQRPTQTIAHNMLWGPGQGQAQSSPHVPYPTESYHAYGQGQDHDRQGGQI